HDRNIGGGHLKTIEQILTSGIAVEIDVRIWMRVARQKLSDAQRLRRIAGAEERDVAETAIDERDAAEDERAHEDLAQLGVGLDEREKLLPLHLDHFARLGHSNRRHAAASSQQIQFAGELSRLECQEDFFDAGSGKNTFDSSGDDDEERVMLLPRLNEDVAAHHRSLYAACGNARDLVRRQRRN